MSDNDEEDFNIRKPVFPSFGQKPANNRQAYAQSKEGRVGFWRPSGEGFPKEKYPGFEAAVRPVMKWLAENGHPHMKIVVESNVAELVEGVKVVQTDEYLID